MIWMGGGCDLSGCGGNVGGGDRVRDSGMNTSTTQEEGLCTQRQRDGEEEEELFRRKARS